VKVKYTFLKIGLLLILTTLLVGLLGCNIQAEDQWPVITTWGADANYAVSAKIDANTGIPIITWPASWFTNMTVDVRTYNANQAFKATIILTSIESEGVTLATGDITGSTLLVGDFTEPFVIDRMQGSYVADSGNPPQGITELKFGFVPRFIPDSIGAWYDGTHLTLRYILSFKIIIEDAGGRTDTINLAVDSNLKIS
jgi:hypothetical protein